MAVKKLAPARKLSSLIREMEHDLRAIRRALSRPIEAEIARAKLTVPQVAFMRVVVARQNINLKELSRELSLAHSTVSGIADRLEKAGMITRQPDPTDGRVMRIQPTPEVVNYVARQVPALVRGPLYAALQRASSVDRAAIAAAISKLRTLLESA